MSPFETKTFDKNLQKVKTFLSERHHITIELIHLLEVYLGNAAEKGFITEDL